jgi:hypothetical protein
MRVQGPKIERIGSISREIEGGDGGWGPTGMDTAAGTKNAAGGAFLSRIII